MDHTKKSLSSEQTKEILTILKDRFEKNMNRHAGVDWSWVEKKLSSQSEKLWSLSEMERTGGEPDVVAYDAKTGAYNFYDCSSESPLGRRSLCYDRQALDARKANKPENSVMDIANALGIEILTEEEYNQLQKIGNFDLKTSSWLHTPADVRKLGGAIFGDRRYDRIFIYHNGADSYYAARGFRGSLKV